MATAIDFCCFFPSLTSSPSVYGGEDVNFPSSRPFSDRSFDIVIENFGSETPSFYDGFTVKY
ncbi:MAG: hypothetical protein GPJ04_21765 [Microcystis aeruginosa G13-03]|nr:hypothetical protein [Microcystis aeruginosa G13-03]